MSVEDPRVVDLVGIDKRTGRVVLTISDHLHWDAGDHLTILQDKLNAYLAFVESGELVQQYPDASGRQPQIAIVCKYPPDDRALRFLEEVGSIVEREGIVLTHETLAH